MNAYQFWLTIKRLYREWYNLPDYWIEWKEFSYEVFADQELIIYNKVWASAVYRKILKELESYDERENIVSNELSLSDWLYWLYHCYPYGYDNASNSCLTDENDVVFAVNDNWLDRTTRIKVSEAIYPWYVVYNNKKKIETDKILYKDINLFLKENRDYVLNHNIQW